MCAAVTAAQVTDHGDSAVTIQWIEADEKIQHCDILQDQQQQQQRQQRQHRRQLQRPQCQQQYQQLDNEAALTKKQDYHSRLVQATQNNGNGGRLLMEVLLRSIAGPTAPVDPLPIELASYPKHDEKSPHDRHRRLRKPETTTTAITTTTTTAAPAISNQPSHATAAVWNATTTTAARRRPSAPTRSQSTPPAAARVTAARCHARSPSVDSAERSLRRSAAVPSPPHIQQRQHQHHHQHQHQRPRTHQRRATESEVIWKGVWD